MKRRKKKSTPAKKATAKEQAETEDKMEPLPTSDSSVGRHLRIGWWSLLVFLTLGIVLEALHGFKVGWYLDTMNTTRRLMFTLAHAHGVLLSLVHIGFAFTLRSVPKWRGQGTGVASSALTAAAVLIPGGFLLGGIWIYDGDPGLGILLVPVGAICLFAAVFLTARGCRNA